MRSIVEYERQRGRRNHPVIATGGQLIHASRRRGQRHRRKQRLYTDRESYKWEKASRRVAKRVIDEVKQRLVSVCDRESDVFEYITYKKETPGHFVVRAAWNRGVENAEETRLWQLAKSAKVLGERQVVVCQRGGKRGRKARTTTVEVASCPVRLKAPMREVGSRRSISG
jgi:hypothetical protein